MEWENLGAELLEDLHSDLPRVEITGNSRVQIENHRGILEYDDTCLRVRCSNCEVVIAGSDLALTALSLDEAAVVGTIFSVSYVALPARGKGGAG